jgi:ethanolamine utilization protein EutN
MILGSVTGTVVATEKKEQLKGHALMTVRPITLEGKRAGADLVAIDTVSAGTGDTVLVVEQGEAAAQVIGRDDAPVRCVIVAVVDGMEIAG